MEELNNASPRGCRHDSLLIDGTFADPHAAIHLRSGRAIIDSSATSTVEAFSAHVSLVWYEHHLIGVASNLAPQKWSFTGLGKGGVQLVLEGVSSLVRGSHGRDTKKNRLVQIAVPKRVAWCRLTKQE